MLRDYQERVLQALYQWAEKNTGDPCVVMPTGSGKSHIVAAIAKDTLQNAPDARVLMLTHVKELIEQNAEKMLQHWPDAPLGIFSASMRKRDLTKPITFASIQSVWRRADEIGVVDLIIVDECHLISHSGSGMYRSLISDLRKINPKLIVVGLTATPFRLGHGCITDSPALFSGLIETVTIEGLIQAGYLAPLRSKITEAKLSAQGVAKRGGEYVEKELQAKVNTPQLNKSAAAEIVARADWRKHWLVFCAGIDHARAMSSELLMLGVSAACVTGDTPKHERERIIDEFKAGKITALTNANVLTTGFDYPDIDLIALCRPTLSPGLYLQMAGRGMRVKSHTDHCLVLDFAGVVETHGPVVNVSPPKKAEAQGGEPPSKVCDNCGELNHAAVLACVACGALFPARQPPKLKLRHDADIMGDDLHKPRTMRVTRWRWDENTSLSGIKNIVIRYYGGLTDPVVKEYFNIRHPGYAGERARIDLFKIMEQRGDHDANYEDLRTICNTMQEEAPPGEITYRVKGKFYIVEKRRWG